MNSYSTFLKSIQFVLVAYGEDFRKSPAYASVERIASSTTAMLHLAVHDNSPALAAGALPFHDRIQLRYIPQPENRGISQSYNDAANSAAKEGRKWLLFLDQDTRLPSSLPTLYFEAIRANPTIKLFCPRLQTQAGKFVSPFAWHLSRGTPLGRIETGVVPCSHRSVCNSSMLVDIETYHQAGGYNPDIFLDYSDVSFFRRYARTQGSFFLIDEIVEHNLSSMEELDPDKALFRFGKYCESAQAYGKEFSTISLVRVYGFIRAVKLAAKWKDHRFLAVYLSMHRKGA